MSFFVEFFRKIIFFEKNYVKLLTNVNILCIIRVQ